MPHSPAVTLLIHSLPIEMDHIAVFLPCLCHQWDPDGRIQPYRPHDSCVIRRAHFNGKRTGPDLLHGLHPLQLRLHLNPQQIRLEDLPRYRLVSTFSWGLAQTTHLVHRQVPSRVSRNCDSRIRLRLSHKLVQ